MALEGTTAAVGADPGGGFAVLFAIGMIGARGPLDVLESVLLCALMAYTAVAPRGVYDGRFAAWCQAHPVLATVSVAVVLALLLLGILRDFLDLGVSLLISAGFSGCFAVLALVLERRGERRSKRA